MASSIDNSFASNFDDYFDDFMAQHRPYRRPSMYSKATTHTEKKIKRSCEDEKADLTLVSADGVHFKVDLWRLTAASPVFRDMLASSVKASEDKPASNVKASKDNEVLRLCDSQIEDAPSVKIFLDLLFGLLLPESEWANCRHLFAPLKMVQKYECVNIRGTAIYALRSALHAPEARPIYIFIAAAILKDVETCKRSITFLTAPVSSNAAPPASPFQTKGGHPNTFDPRATTFELHSTIPRDYCFALMRARLTVEIGARESLASRMMTEKERIDCAEEFAKVIRELPA